MWRGLCAARREVWTNPGVDLDILSSQLRQKRSVRSGLHLQPELKRFHATYSSAKAALARARTDL